MARPLRPLAERARGTSEPYDVIIVGAGPAGSSLAIELARAGRRVLVIDKDRFPRDKVCGDFVSPRGLALLRPLDCLEEVLSLVKTPIRSSIVHLDDRQLVRGTIPQVEGLPEFGVAVPRRIFDEILFRRARTLGAETIEGARVTDLTTSEKGVVVTAVVEGAHRTFAARVVVGADGASSIVARKVSDAAPDARVMPTLRAYVTGLEFTHGHFFFDSRFFPGFGWIFPTGPDTANVGVGAPKELLTSESLRLRDFFDRLKQRLRTEAAEVGAVVEFSQERGFPIRVYAGSGRYSFQRGLLVGEAARLVDPISGEGIALALESSNLAARTLSHCLDRDDFGPEALRAYDTAIEKRFGFELGVADLVVSAVKNRALSELWIWMFRWMGSTARRDSVYASQMGGILAGLVPNWKAFSPELMVKPLLHLPRFWLEEFPRLLRNPTGTPRAASGPPFAWLFAPERWAAQDASAFAGWGAELLEKQRRLAAKFPSLGATIG